MTTKEAVTEIRPGVAGVIRDPQGRILLHRRVIGDGWAPPSGSVEPGEDVLRALVRELQEETALTVDGARLIAVYSDPSFQIVDYPDGRRVHFVTCVFACRVGRADVLGSTEGVEWRWFYPSALPTDLLPYARIWLGDALSHTTSVTVR